MKIDITTINPLHFFLDKRIVFGEPMVLIQPRPDYHKFTQATKIFRSSLWTDDGELVSAGFPKFTNWEENPENFPVPKSLKDAIITEKLDGSLLIASRYKGNIILRTRGTVDASKLENGHELTLFREKLMKSIRHDTPETWNVSLLFEWVSPNQRIVLNYGTEPEWFMVGIINHGDYSLYPQSSLDMWAKNHDFKRPTVYKFPTFNELAKNVEQWKNKEGVVIYTNNGQVLHKLKSVWYLSLHKMKEDLASIEKIIDVWFDNGEMPYQEFEKFIIEKFDWELWTQIQSEVSRICDANKEVQRIIAGFKRYLEVLRPYNRETQFYMATAAYGETSRRSMIMKMLDGIPLNQEDRKKLLYQCLKAGK